ncbi:hypothetical protein QT970_01545 [Microcoleus sp. herbarium8]|uniref:hypothetical protein n=1 Tax=Microcoleus sp. herbarium8 TaxID=3055436 RepID=UPI002FD42FFF
MDYTVARGAYGASPALKKRIFYGVSQRCNRLELQKSFLNPETADIGQMQH